jgi:hypothetical protein
MCYICENPKDMKLDEFATGYQTKMQRKLNSGMIHGDRNGRI